MSIRMSVYMSIHMSMYMSIHMSMYMPIHMSIHMPAHSSPNPMRGGSSLPTYPSTRAMSPSPSSTTRRKVRRASFIGHVGSISGSPTARPLRGYGRAGTQNDRLSEAVILSTGTTIPAQWTCRRRCRDIVMSVTASWHRKVRRASFIGHVGSISASPTARPLRGYGRAGTQNDRLSLKVMTPLRAITPYTGHDFRRTTTGDTATTP